MMQLINYYHLLQRVLQKCPAGNIRLDYLTVGTTKGPIYLYFFFVCGGGGVTLTFFLY